MFPGCNRLGSSTEAVENARYFIFRYIKLEKKKVEYKELARSGQVWQSSSR